jgi:hypothetical protein
MPQKTSRPRTIHCQIRGVRDHDACCCIDHDRNVLVHIRNAWTYSSVVLLCAHRQSSFACDFACGFAWHHKLVLCNHAKNPRWQFELLRILKVAAVTIVNIFIFAPIYLSLKTDL